MPTYSNGDEILLGKPLAEPLAKPKVGHPPSSGVLLALIVAAIMVVAFAVFISLDPAGSTPAGFEQAPAAEGTLPLRASEATSEFGGGQQFTTDWLLLLVAAVALLQIFPLLLAYRRAKEVPLSLKAHRTISFLCETPMYLGLLGSLLGVCLTQIIRGDLAAPLAYLTTISGILLYLFGKFFIWLGLEPLAEEEE